MTAATDPVGFGLGAAASVLVPLLLAVLAVATVVAVVDTVRMRRAGSWPIVGEPLFPRTPCPPGCACRWSRRLVRTVHVDLGPEHPVSIVAERNIGTGHVRILSAEEVGR